MPFDPEGVGTDAVISGDLSIDAWLGDPRERRVPLADSKPQHLGNKKSGNRVLIVGRNRELALYRAEVLRQRGFQVSIAETKEDALAIIRNAGFDVAVLSYTLPSATVQEIAEEIREQCPSCPIIAIAESTRFDRRIAPDAIVVAEEGPPALVAALRNVMRSS